VSYGEIFRSLPPHSFLAFCGFFRTARPLLRPFFISELYWFFFVQPGSSFTRQSFRHQNISVFRSPNGCFPFHIYPLEKLAPPRVNSCKDSGKILIGQPQPLPRHAFLLDGREDPLFENFPELCSRRAWIINRNSKHSCPPSLFSVPTFSSPEVFPRCFPRGTKISLNFFPRRAEFSGGVQFVPPSSDC